MTTKTMTTMTRTTTSRFVLLFLCLAGIVSGQKKAEPYALVRGSVFLESGLAQPGAKVILSSKAKPDKKLQEQVSNSQGEFAFRVPPGPASYILTATLKGFEPAIKEVDVVGQEQINKTLLLTPASKK